MKQILKFEDFKGKTITEVFTGDGWEFEWAAFKFSDDTFGFIQSTSGYEDSGLAAPDIIGEPFSVHRSGINNLLVSLGVQTQAKLDSLISDYRKNITQAWNHQ